MKPKPLYMVLASLIGARGNCIKSRRAEWQARHEERAHYLARTHLPGGSGFDAGTQLDIDASTAEKLVLRTSFHHMDESGGYAGWSDHIVTVRPSLAHGFRLTISGRNRNGIKEYIGDTFELALMADALMYEVNATGGAQ